MKKIHSYILEHEDFLHGVFVAVHWLSLLLVFAIKTDNSVKREWTDTAFILCGIGYLSFILFPILIIQSKFIFRKHSLKITQGIIIVLFYSEIVLYLQFIITAFFSKNAILFCFANPGVMFMYSCFEKVNKKVYIEHGVGGPGQHDRGGADNVVGDVHV
jgi:hypothetical protein